MLAVGTRVDFIAESNQTLNIPIGVNYFEFPILINQDSSKEGDETFMITLSNPTNVKFAGGSSTIEIIATIVDDEVPVLSVENQTPSFRENIGMANIGLNLSGPTGRNVVVTYSTSIEGADTAQQADFIARSSQTLTIQSNQTSGVIPISIVNDLDSENDEKFTLTLLNITGAVFSGEATKIVVEITIIDDEGLPTLMVDTTSC